MQGSAVDVNQIPFAALERVEVLQDGASAVYGTDALGGVINFITKTDFTGIDVAGFTDTTQGGQVVGCVNVFPGLTAWVTPLEIWLAVGTRKPVLYELRNISHSIRVLGRMRCDHAGFAKRR